MRFEKSLLGEQTTEGLQVKYYIIHHKESFGIGIEEERKNSIQCHYEYFTENQTEAYKLGEMMQEGFVTGTTMINIIDDYIQ